MSHRKWRETKQHVVWPSCAWLLLSFSPFQCVISYVAALYGCNHDDDDGDVVDEIRFSARKSSRARAASQPEDGHIHPTESPKARNACTALQHQSANLGRARDEIAPDEALCVGLAKVL